MLDRIEIFALMLMPGPSYASTHSRPVHLALRIDLPRVALPNRFSTCLLLSILEPSLQTISQSTPHSTPPPTTAAMSSTTPAPRRRATHAGSWYSSSPSKLDAQLTGWLNDVHPSAIPPAGEVASLSTRPSSDSDPHPVGLRLPVEGCRAIIGPHAGYSYSGPAAAWAYRCIPSNPSAGARIKRVFLLGPSHHHYLDRCALSRCSAYETPLGDLVVDAEVSKEIMQSGKRGDWEWMEREVDEAEHSIEMHAAYVRKVFEG